MTTEIKYEYYDDEKTKIKSEEYYLNGKCHRKNDKPAIMYYFESGIIKGEYYILNGKYHRENKPASIDYYESGIIKRESYHLNGKLHRENDKPAIIYYFESGKIQKECYYLNSKCYRENENDPHKIEYHEFRDDMTAYWYDENYEIIKKEEITGFLTKG